MEAPWLFRYIVEGQSWTERVGGQEVCVVDANDDPGTLSDEVDE